MNGLTLLVLIALAIGVFVAYRMGKYGQRDAAGELPLRATVTNASPAPIPTTYRDAEPSALRQWPNDSETEG